MGRISEGNRVMKKTKKKKIQAKNIQTKNIQTKNIQTTVNIQTTKSIIIRMERRRRNRNRKFLLLNRNWPYKKLLNDITRIWALQKMKIRHLRRINMAFLAVVVKVNRNCQTERS